MALIPLEIASGLGRHVHDVPVKFLELALKCQLAANCLYYVATGLTKVSIVFFYLRIFPDRLSRNLNYATMLVVFLETIAVVLATILQCSPVQGFWDKNIPSKCIDSAPIFQFAAAFNIFSDAWLIALCAPKVLRLNTQLPQKIAVTSVLSMGVL